MSRIRSKNTKIEMLVFKELRKRKIYFKKHYKSSFGNIDIALPKRKIAVFLDGDFWHGYNFKRVGKRLPKTYWLKKIEDNIKRDKVRRSKLKKAGWKIIRMWEHEIQKNLEKTIEKIVNFMK